MAEGDSQAASLDPSSLDNTDLTDSYILDCPICLEQLRQPKSLPCLHSLCEDCLSSYIVSEVSETSGTATSFTCPVCRTLTHPVDKSENIEKWARQFPNDKVAMGMIKLRNRKTEPHYCMPCQKKGKMTTPAQFLCKTNQSLFCLSCKVDFHDMIHINCDIVDITESGRFLLEQLSADKTCDKHKEKMDYYCVDHKSLGCSKCITVGHRKCEEVATTEDYCEKLKSSSLLEETKKSLQQGAKAMESLIEDFYLQLQNIADDKDAALKSIEDLHERIDKCVKEMKQEITDDLVRSYKEEKENLQQSSQKCERLKVAIQNTLESSTASAKGSDHMETILLYQKGQMEVESCTELMREMQKSPSTVSIEHKDYRHVKSLGKVLNFGKIVVRKQGRLAPSVTKVFVKPLSKCEVKEVKKVKIKSPSDTSDCIARGVVYLNDGRIVVSDDGNQKIKLINTEGYIVDELKINGRPYDLCMVDNNAVAAALYSPGGIRILTVTPSKLTVTSEINTEISCYGIAYRDGEFVVSSGLEVFSVIRNGTKVATRKLYSGTGDIYTLSYDSQHGHLYTTHYNNSDGILAVGKLSADNRHTDVLKVGVVRDPYGVDVDVEGNVYVCGYTSNNVVQISGDGTKVRELLTTGDGIDRPEAISVCGDRLVLTNLSPKQCNYITVFQLV